MKDTTWKTAISKVEANALRLRGYRLDELMGNIGFADGIFLLFMGELPTQEQSKLINAMLLSSIDHGPTPPSALATRTSASTGAALNAAVATGILSINRFHGGAIQDCMEVLDEGLNLLDEFDGDIEKIAKRIVDSHLTEKKRIPGLGHRIHTDDPRTRRLFSLAKGLDLSGDGIALLEAIRNEFIDRGKTLPINVDGALAAILTDLRFPKELANAFFIISRMPGLAAHYLEELRRERPMRRIHPTEHKYDGPPDRSP